MSESRVTLEALTEALADLVTDEYVLDAMYYAYEETATPARAVTEEEATSRPMQEVVWVGEVIRFRENMLVSRLLGPPHARSKRPIEPWMEEQIKELAADGGNEIVRWLLANGPADLNQIALQQFPQKDEEQFAMLIGYSVSGAGDLSYFSPAMIARADTEADRLVAERDAG